jgi:hypothetical protein
VEHCRIWPPSTPPAPRHTCCLKYQTVNVSHKSILSNFKSKCVHAAGCPRRNQVQSAICCYKLILTLEKLISFRFESICLLYLLWVVVLIRWSRWPNCLGCGTRCCRASRCFLFACLRVLLGRLLRLLTRWRWIRRCWQFLSEYVQQHFDPFMILNLVIVLLLAALYLRIAVLFFLGGI